MYLLSVPKIRMPDQSAQHGNRRAEVFFGPDDYQAYMDPLVTAKPRP